MVGKKEKKEPEHTLFLIREGLPAVLKNRPVKAAYLYGSVARGVSRGFSDIDIALVLSEPLPPYETLMLELEIQGALEALKGLKNLDVRSINGAPLRVRGQILQEGILVYERDREARVAFEAYTRRVYLDFLPTVRRLESAFLRKIRREGLLYGRPPDNSKKAGDFKGIPEETSNLSFPA